MRLANSILLPGASRCKAGGVVGAWGEVSVVEDLVENPSQVAEGEMETGRE